MAHLDDVAAFVSVVRQGSFTAAARLLKLPPTTVSRRVRLLEDRLGVRLLQRTTRSMWVTDAGRRYYDACSGGLTLIEDADREARGAQAEPSGAVRISAPVNLGAQFFTEVVAGFLTRHPRAKTELLLTDDRLDLVQMRIDVALRTGTLPDSAMVARRLSSARRCTVASPAYLAQHGTPQIPDDLRQHDCIVRGDSIAGATWTFSSPAGTEVVAVNGRISVNVMSFGLLAALAGLGIAQLPEALAMPDITAGRLVPILDAFVRDENALYLLLPSNRHMSAAVRAFIDHVSAWASGLPHSIEPDGRI